jgi:spore maturation protein CgeB
VHRPDPQPGDGDVPAHDVVFVGTGFEERCRFLAAVDWTGVDLGLYGEWSLLPRRMRRYVRGRQVPNPVAAALYRRARVVLNLHRQSREFGRGATRVAPGEAESMNPRLYELAACRAFVLSDPRPELLERAGDAVPTFTTPEELRRLVHQALQDPAWRSRCAAKLHARLGGEVWLQRAAVVARELRARVVVRGPGALVMSQ